MANTNSNPKQGNIFCTHCGAQQIANERFCSSCGNEFVNSHGTSVKKQTLPFQLPKLSKVTQDHPIVITIGIIVGLIAICSFVGGTSSLSGLLRGKLPNHGAFVKNSFIGYTEIPTIAYGDRKFISPSQFPVVGKNPTIILWVPQVDLSFLEFGEEIGGLGTTFTTQADKYPVLSDISSDGGAELAGLHLRDILIEIGGVDMKGFKTKNIRSYSLGPVGSSVEVVIEREGETITYIVERRPIESNSLPFEQSSDGQYWELTPTHDLSPGLYCFLAGNVYLTLDDLPAWCFMVE